MRQGWIHPKIAWVGCQRICPGVALSSWLYLWNVSPFSHGCLCLLWDEVGQKRNGRTRSRAQRTGEWKSRISTGHQPCLWKWRKANWSTIVSAPNALICGVCLATVAHHDTRERVYGWHHGEGPYFQPWYPSAEKCPKIKKNLSFIEAI